MALQLVNHFAESRKPKKRGRPSQMGRRQISGLPTTPHRRRSGRFAFRTQEVSEKKSARTAPRSVRLRYELAGDPLAGSPSTKVALDAARAKMVAALNQECSKK
jgi:hypothetical protein